MLNKERVSELGGEQLRSGEIPVLGVSGVTLPEAWEASVLWLLQKGTEIKTMYDRPGDPPSVDATMTITVSSPMSEPRIHRFFPTGLDELYTYTQEVIEGVRDWKIVEDESQVGYSYTYNERLTRWPGEYGFKNIESINGIKIALPGVDQIDRMARELADTPFSRRAQAITWNPMVDPGLKDPPCLQSIWGRVVFSEEDRLWLFDMNVRFRSNDAVKAAFMNMFALIEYQRKIAGLISDYSGREVIPGRYVHQADSYHVYGSYFVGGKSSDVAKFLDMSKKDWEDRTLWTNDERVQIAFEDGRERLAREEKALKERNLTT